MPESPPPIPTSSFLRLLQRDGLVVATHNPGKCAEIEELLTGLIDRIQSAAALGLPEPEETGMTFMENALLKATATTLATGLPALADDSGLTIDALGGAPGIYSARWAGPKRDFFHAMQKVEAALQTAGASDAASRRCEFVSALALALPDGSQYGFEGRCAGTVQWPPRGSKGFGYDPIFLPDGYDITFGEMAPDEKRTTNHRARAFAQLRRLLEDAPSAI